MNLSDILASGVRIGLCDGLLEFQLLPSREDLERIALALAAREREFADLAARLDQQQAALASTRKLLLAILWPRRQQPTT